MFGKDTIESCPEFRRILELPVHDPPQEHWDNVADLITEHTKTPQGTMRLKPIQGQMCAEAYDAGGLFAMAPVGSGKTLPSLLIPSLLGAVRPILLVKASLRAKTISDQRYYGEHFRIHDGIRLLSYDMLSQPHAQDILLDLNPDMIIADEAQALKNMSAARTRRFLRFMNIAARNGSRIKFIALSGTMTRRALKDYWHLMCLAHPAGGSPLPYREAVLERWGMALDAKVDEFRRVAPGVLLQLADGFGVDAGEPLVRARAGLHRRMVSTLGVVSMEASSCDKPLTLHGCKLPLPNKIAAAMHHLRTTFETPCGDECDSTLEVWRHARELACGFYSVWDPEAPKPWLEARKDWHRFVRRVLARDDPKLDSPFLIAKEYADHPLHRAWEEIRPTFEPNYVAKWVDDFLLQDASRWLLSTGGIAWVEHVTVGERLSKISGAPYYGGGPRAAKDILNPRGPIICSIKAHCEGRNLQMYRDNLILSCPPSGATLEQLIGRTHRHGQIGPVNVSVYTHCEELQKGLLTAFEDARYIQQTTGIAQKLLLAQNLTGLQE